MILFLAESGKVYEALDANLESPQGQSAGHFADSEALRAFLRKHPDTAFSTRSREPPGCTKARWTSTGTSFAGR